MVGENVQKLAGFDSVVNIWVFEETLPSGAKLSEVFNATHQNQKYLPDVTLPSNLRAVPDLVQACADASHLIFVVPHQFLHRTCDTIANAHVLKPGAKAISLIK